MEHRRMQNRAAVEMETEADSDLSCDEELDDPLAFDSGDAAHISDEGELSDDEQMEEQEDLPRTTGMELAATNENAWISKDKTISYNREPIDSHVHSFYGRYHANIESGPRGAALDVQSLKSAFLLFLEPIQDTILHMTNVYGIEKFDTDWQCLDMDTLHAFIGLLLAAGVDRSYGESLDELWSEVRGRQFYRVTMSRERFKMIYTCIRFDRPRDPAARGRDDKFAAIRDVFETWQKELPKNYTIGKCVTADEQLVAFRGGCAFRQCMPMKPAKYGLKFFLLCDASTRYVYTIQPYLGQVGPARDRNLGQRVVLDLCKDLYDRNVTCGDFFTSMELAKKLKSQRMTIVGTIRKDRTELPPVLIDVRTKPVYTTVEAYQHNVPATLVSYVPKRDRFVTLLSTYHRNVDYENNAKKKPSLITFYNQTSGGGVDVMDQMVGTFTCSRKINRWPMIVFANMLDISAMNAFTIWIHLNPGWLANRRSARRRLFLIQLTEELVKPYVDKRATRLRAPAAQSAVRQSESVRVCRLANDGRRGRCYICTSTRNRNVFASRCENCEKFICAEHRYNICTKCGHA